MYLSAKLLSETGAFLSDLSSFYYLIKPFFTLNYHPHVVMQKIYDCKQHEASDMKFFFIQQIIHFVQYFKPDLNSLTKNCHHKIMQWTFCWFEVVPLYFFIRAVMVFSNFENLCFRKWCPAFVTEVITSIAFDCSCAEFWKMCLIVSCLYCLVSMNSSLLLSFGLPVLYYFSYAVFR